MCVCVCVFVYVCICVCVCVCVCVCGVCVLCGWCLMLTFDVVGDSLGIDLWCRLVNKDEVIERPSAELQYTRVPMQRRE